MSNLIPIQITLQAANAADARQLVHDLAGTMPTHSVAPAAPIQQPSAAQTPFSAPQAPTYAASLAPNFAAPVAPPPAPVATAPMAQPPVAAPMPPYGPPATVPTSAQSYTLEQLAVAATMLIDSSAEMHDRVTALLNQQFGVQALTALPKEQYGNFATSLRALGARI